MDTGFRSLERFPSYFNNLEPDSVFIREFVCISFSQDVPVMYEEKKESKSGEGLDFFIGNLLRSCI